MNLKSLAGWLLPFLAAAAAHAWSLSHARPYVNGEFEGRIAWSADGNHHDPDDWIASPLALAIFAEAGLRDRLVHFDYKHRNDARASHRINVTLPAGTTRGRIRTKFEELYAQSNGRFDVEIRFMDEPGSRGQFALFVNGTAHGAAGQSAGEGRGWTSQVIRDVPIRMGGALRVDGSGAPARIDYVQLTAAAGVAP